MAKSSSTLGRDGEKGRRNNFHIFKTVGWVTSFELLSSPFWTFFSFIFPSFFPKSVPPCSMESIDRKDLRATVITYSAAISACEKGSQWPKALLLLQHMDRRPSFVLISWWLVSNDFKKHVGVCRGTYFFGGYLQLSMISQQYSWRRLFLMWWRIDPTKILVFSWKSGACPPTSSPTVLPSAHAAVRQSGNKPCGSSQNSTCWICKWMCCLVSTSTAELFEKTCFLMDLV